MVIASTRYHSANIGNDLVRSEKRAIHPTTTLLHEDCEALRSVSECLSVGDVLDSVSSVFFNVDLQAHDPVLGQILIGLSAGRGLSAGHVFKERI